MLIVTFLREINSLQQQLEGKKQDYDSLLKETSSLRLCLTEQKRDEDNDRKDVTMSVSFLFIYIKVKK